MTGAPKRAGWFDVMRDPLQDREATRNDVVAGAGLSSSYLLMNMAATVIAGYGLIGNSEAVVIGAMLIAMLYGPILGIGLALAELDAALLMRALVAETVGAALVFAIGLLLGFIHADAPISDQMLARATPNIVHVLIALAGGAAGAYAVAQPRVSAAAAGVALATALCPPLAASGILLAHGYKQLAAGALLLYVTNLTAIAAAAMAVFFAAGHRARPVAGAQAARWSARAAPLLLLALLGAYLVDVFHKAVETARLRELVQKALEADVAGTRGARVVEVKISVEGARRVATAVIRAPKPFSVETVARLDTSIDRAAGRDISLHIRTVLVEELTRDGAAYASERVAAWR